MNRLLIDSCVTFPYYQARVLREVSPEEVTANIYTLVDVLLHKVHVDLQRGHNIKVPKLI